MNNHFIPQAVAQYTSYSYEHQYNNSPQKDQPPQMSSRVKEHRIMMPMLYHQKSESLLIPQPKPDQMLVSFGRPFVTNTQVRSKSPQNEEIHIRSSSPSETQNLEQIKSILEDLQTPDDSSNDGDNKHHYRERRSTTLQREKKQINLSSFQNTERVEFSVNNQNIPQQSDIPLSIKVEDNEEPENSTRYSTPSQQNHKKGPSLNNEDCQILIPTKQSYKQIFFVVHQEKWVKVEADIKSYPRTWNCRQLSEILAQLYAEEEQKALDYKGSSYSLRYFKFNKQSGSEDIIDLDQMEKLSKVFQMVDFSFNLDYFWLKITEQ